MRASFWPTRPVATWIFFWEMGGQNIPNDWTDLQDDLRLEAKTVPVRFGPAGSVRLIFASLAFTVGFSMVLFWMTPNRMGPQYLVGSLLAGSVLLLLPAHRLHKGASAREAIALFNRASTYPLAMLFVVMVSW